MTKNKIVKELRSIASILTKTSDGIFRAEADHALEILKDAINDLFQNERDNLWAKTLQLEESNPSEAQKLLKTIAALHQDLKDLMSEG